MDGQMFIVVGVIAAAAAYLGRSAWRTWFAGGCGGGCGGCKASAAETMVPGRVSLPTVR